MPKAKMVDGVEDSDFNAFTEELTDSEVVNKEQRIRKHWSDDVEKKRNQLYWFVNELIRESKSPVGFDTYDEHIIFPVDLLRKEKTGLFPLGEYDGATEFESEDKEYAFICERMLEKIKSDIPILQKDNPGLATADITWSEDPGFYGLGYIIILYCEHKTIFDSYINYLNRKSNESTKKQSTPEGKIENNRRIILQKTKAKTIVPPPLPENLMWEEITIRFLNGHEVHITTRGESYQTNYELMGFQDEKTKRPNLQWGLLTALAIKGGFLGWENNADLDGKKDAVKHRKKSLSDTLKAYFHTVEGDPFLNYKKAGGYEIKIRLAPETLDRGDVVRNHRSNHPDDMFSNSVNYDDDIYSND